MQEKMSASIQKFKRNTKDNQILLQCQKIIYLICSIQYNTCNTCTKNISIILIFLMIIMCIIKRMNCTLFPETETYYTLNFLILNTVERMRRLLRILGRECLCSTLNVITEMQKNKQKYKDGAIV